MTYEIDDLATYDAGEIKRLTALGEPLSTVAAGFGYTPYEGRQLLGYAVHNKPVPVKWWDK